MKNANYYLPKFILLGLFIGLFCSSCSKDEDTTTTPVDTTPIAAFLKLGNEQKMDYTYKSSTSGLDTTVVNFMLMKVTKDLGSGKFQINFTNPLGNDSTVILKDQSGLSEEDSTGAGSFFMMCKATPVKDEIYMHFKKNGAQTDTVFRKVMNIAKSVTVKGGTFECVEIREYTGVKNMDKNYDLEYLDLKTGFIKNEGYAHDGSAVVKTATIELSSKNY